MGPVGAVVLLGKMSEERKKQNMGLSASWRGRRGGERGCAGLEETEFKVGETKREVESGMIISAVFLFRGGWEWEVR